HIEGNLVLQAGVFPFSILGDGNTVTRNVVDGSPSTGGYVHGVNNSFTGNRGTKKAGGGFFFGSAFSCPAACAGAGTPNALPPNPIAGSGVGLDASALDPSDPAIDATGNWWGCPAGPGNPGCDTVTGNADASTPLGAPAACVNCASNADCSDGLICSGA